MTPRTAPHRWRRALAGASLLLLVALLPALVAGRNIDAPAAPGELARVQQGLERGRADPGSAGSLVARLFYGAALAQDEARLPAAEPVQAALLAQARLAQVAGVFGIALLVYLCTALALGRARALLAAALLAVVPPVHAMGHVLRPETPAALAGLMGLLLLECLPSVLRPAGGRTPARKAAVAAAFALCAAVAFGFAVAALPAAGLHLLVPAAAMFAAALQLGYRFLRVVPRRRWPSFPLRAMTQRLWPWTLAALGAQVAGLLLMRAALQVDADALPATAAMVGLLPHQPVLRVVLLALAGFGAVALCYRVGRSYGRVGRLRADVVLLLHCAVLLLAQVLAAEPPDALPVCGAFAIVLAEGLAALAWLVLPRLWLWRRTGAA